MPNFVLFSPVDIFLCVLGEMSGFILRHMLAVILSLEAILWISLSSSSDSILNCKILFLRANSISVFSFPTPENIIFFGETPAAIHFLNSPMETMSAPHPNFAK